MSRVNFENFQSSNEVIVGFSSLYNDGSAITSGAEPIFYPGIDYARSFHMEFWVKSSTLTKMYLLSIANGASTTRFLDAHIVDGDKFVLFYDGVETTHTFTASTDYVHFALSYNTSSNTMYIAANNTTTSVAFAADPALATTEGIHLFRAIHEDADYFNGHIGNIRVRKNANLISAATYNATLGQQLNWLQDSNYPIVGTQEILLQTTNTVSGGGPQKQHHSFSYYDDKTAVVVSADTWGGNWTKTVKLMTTPTAAATKGPWGPIAARGTHYFPSTGTLLIVNGDTGDISSVDTLTDTKTVINNGGTYKSCRGDHEHTYLFGRKENGGVNQIFRMNPDGTGEITLDMNTITGANGFPAGFALDDDNHLVFFHDSITNILRSVDYDLTAASYLTYDLELQQNDWGDMDYAQGYLYHGGREPATGGYNSRFYRFEIATGNKEEIGGTSESLRGGKEGTVDVFIHRALNEMWVSGESKVRHITGTNFDYYQTFMYAGDLNVGGATISWDPVVGATSYELFKDGVSVGTTPSAELVVTGLGSAGTTYKFTLKSSTDDVTYEPVVYYVLQYSAGSQFSTQTYPSPPNWPAFNGMFTIVDPYSPFEFLVTDVAGNGVYTYNITTDTTESVAPYYVGIEDFNMACRSWTNKKIYYAPNTAGNTIYDAGIGGSKFAAYSTLAEYIADTSNIVFTASANFRCMTSNYHAKEIFYAVDTVREIRVVGQNGTGDRLVATVGNQVRGIAMDPHDSSYLIYSSANNIWHLDLTDPALPVSTRITSDYLHTNDHDLMVLDGTIYGQMYGRPGNNGMYTMKIDGSDYFKVAHVDADGNDIFPYARQFALDTVAQTMTSINRTVGVNIITNANMSSLPPDPSLLLVKASPFGLNITWGAVQGAYGYGFGLADGPVSAGYPINILTSSLPSTADKFRVSKGISSGKTYTLYFYYASALGASADVLVTATEVTTPSGGGAGDYDTSFFANDNGNGGFDLSSLSTANLKVMADLMNDLFSTGDEIHMKLPSGRSVATKMVKRGETVALSKKNASLSVPFSTTGGSGQSVSLTLTDDTTVSITYDQVSEEITVGGQAYESGESFLLDGKKVTVYDI